MLKYNTKSLRKFQSFPRQKFPLLSHPLFFFESPCQKILGPKSKLIHYDYTCPGNFQALSKLPRKYKKKLCRMRKKQVQMDASALNLKSWDRKVSRDKLRPQKKKKKQKWLLLRNFHVTGCGPYTTNLILH